MFSYNDYAPEGKAALAEATWRKACEMVTPQQWANCCRHTDEIVLAEYDKMISSGRPIQVEDDAPEDDSEYEDDPEPVQVRTVNTLINKDAFLCTILYEISHNFVHVKFFIRICTQNQICVKFRTTLYEKHAWAMRGHVQKLYKGM